MAWDFTLSTGNKTGATRRTQGANIKRPSSTANRSVSAQAPTVAEDVGNDPLIKTAQTLGQFFGQASARETEEFIEGEKVRNEEAIIEAQRRVAADPEGARAAVLTGDYSAFIEDDELRGRKVVQEKFLTNTAEQNAVAAWDNEGKTFVANLPADSNIDEAYSKWLAERIEGTSPVYADAYMAQGHKSAQKGITNFKNARYKHMVDQSTRAAQATAEAIFKDPNLPKDPKAIEGKIMSSFAGTMIPAPQQALLARQATAAAAMANINNPAAYTYATTVPIDPNNPNSLTIAEHYEQNGLGTIAQWQNKALSSKRNTIDSAANDELSNLEVLATTQPGLAYEGVERMLRNKSVHPLNDRLLKLKTTLAKGIKDGRGMGIWLAVQKDPTVLNKLSEVDRKEYKKTNDSMPADKRIAIAQSGGADPASSARAQALGRQHGMHPKAETETSISNMLTGNPKQRADELDRFRQHRSLTGSTGAGYFGNSPEGKKALMIARVADVSPDLAKKGLERLATFTGNFKSPWSSDPKSGSTHQDTQSVFGAVESQHGYMKDFKGALRQQAYAVLATAYIAFGGDMDMVANAMEKAFPEDDLAYRATGRGTFAAVPRNINKAQWTKESLETADAALDKTYTVKHHPGNPSLYLSGDEGMLGGTKIANDTTGNPLTYAPGMRIHYPVVDGGAAIRVPAELAAIGKLVKNKDGSVTITVGGQPETSDPLIRKGEENIYSVWNGKHWEVVYSETDLLKSQTFTGPVSKRLVQFLTQETKINKEIAEITKSEPEPRDRNEMQQLTSKTAEAKRRLGETQTKIQRIVQMQGTTNAAVLSTLKQYTAAFGGGPNTEKLINELQTSANPVVQGKDEDAEAALSVDKVVETVQADKEVAQLKNRDFHKDPEWSYEKDIESFLIEHEGLTELSYQDTNKATSIGAGFNLDDANTARFIKEAGFDIAALKAGTQQMPKTEARKILRTIYKDKRDRLIKIIGDQDWVKLSDPEQLALVSLFYNTEAAGGGPRLTGAIRVLAEARRTKNTTLEDQALHAIDNEIRYSSLPYKKMIAEGNARYIDALWYRRNSEADKFLGGRIRNEKGDIVFPLRENNWREDPAARELMFKHKSKNKKTWPKFDPRQILNTKRATRITKSRK